MKHAKSNINLMKKPRTGNNKKANNIFKKPAGYQKYNNNYIKSNNGTGRKNYLISLLDKNTPKSLNTNKLNFNTKNKLKEVYLTSGVGENKGNNEVLKTRQNHGNINIRLNLNSEIINNNYNNYYNTTKHKTFHKSLSNINLSGK